MQDIINIRIPNTTIGIGSSHSIDKLVEEFEPQKILIITDEGVVKAGQINNVKSSLEQAGYRFDVFDGCIQNAPSSAVEKCVQVVREGNYDLLIGVGGGSTMDTTKVASVMAPNDISLQDLISGKAVKKVLPKILVPTTAGTGSEWDNGAVITDESVGQKRWLPGDQFFANAAVLDAELTLSSPKKVTADTGMDALCHALEAYFTPKANVLSDMFAETAIKLIANNLREACAKGSQAIEARYIMSIAAALAIKAIEAGSGLAHKISSELVVKAHITHGAACTILIPHNMQFELKTAPQRFARIAELMGEKVNGLSTMEAAQKAVDAVKRLSKDLGMAQTLREVGITEDDIPRFVDNLFKFRSAMLQPSTRRGVTRDDLLEIYRAAL